MFIRLISAVVMLLATGGAAAAAQLSIDGANRYCNGVALGHYSLLLSYVHNYKSPSDYQLIRDKAISDAMKIKDLSDETRFAVGSHINAFSDQHFQDLTEYLKRTGKSEAELSTYFKNNSQVLMPQKFEECRKELRGAKMIK